MTMPWIFPPSPTPPGFAVDWARIDPLFPWLETLRGCAQNPVYHAEGDVLTHTRLVAEALAADPDWRALDATTRGAVFAAALLHDIGKPATSEVKPDGRISSPGHARKGAHLAQDILYREWTGRPVPLDLRRMILWLVRFHGLPLWDISHPEFQRAALRCSLGGPNRLVAMLARADVLGRICQDQQGLLDKLELFREYSLEQGCLDGPYPFPSDHTRYVYFHSEGRSPLVEAYDDTRCQAVLMSGLPGSGKDTWIAANLPGWPVISLDSIRGELDVSPAEPQGPVVERAHQLARGYLRDGVDFVWNATNVSSRLRRSLVELFTANRARVRIVYLETRWPELLRRSDHRDRPVPAEVLDKLARILEVPDPSEAQQVEWLET